MNNENYYSILGVSETATQDEIKKAYRKLAKENHPDIGGDEELFKKISVAYDIIGDENKRKEYDMKRNNPFGMGGDSFDIHSIFEQMMGGKPKPKAADKIFNINITVSESFFGVKKEISLSNFDICNPCNGTGGTKKVCETCKGNGVVIQMFGTGMFRQQFQTQCPSCNGLGSTILNACNTCKGQGVSKKEEKIQVNIPKSVDNGVFLRITQKGDYNPNLKMKGDLILKVNLIDEDKYEKVGIDLIYTKKINPLNLLLDDSMVIEHPEGDLSVKVPEKVNTEKPLRIIGKGFKTQNGDGNFYIKIVVEKEQNLDNETKEKIKNILETVVN
jgi:molecular chaperone DnaJ